MNNYAITYELQNYDLTFVRYVQSQNTDDAIRQFNTTCRSEHPNKLTKVLRIRKVKEQQDKIVVSQ